jgi:curved DNA-binding protein CbpA
LNSGFSENDLKSAFKQMAFIYHPDRNRDRDTTADFIRLQEAYEFLQDPKKLESLNRTYLEDKLFKQCVNGISISFGSFFGYRMVQLNRAPKSLRIGKEVQGEADTQKGIFEISKDDQSQSILDSPSYDSLEVAYAGKFSEFDKDRINNSFDRNAMGALPWIVENNHGLLCFLDGKFEESLRTYVDLNSRVKGNIIFLYREAICRIVLAYQNGTPAWGHKVRPKKDELQLAIRLLRTCIELAETRKFGKQRALTIKRTLADIYEAIGKKLRARLIWNEIIKDKPNSPEANSKIQKLSIVRIFTGRLIGK